MCEIMLIAISNSIISFVHFTLYYYLYTNTNMYNKSNLIECCSNLSGLANKYMYNKFNLINNVCRLKRKA